MCQKKQSHRQSMHDTIIILSMSALIIIVEVMGVFAIRSTRTISKVISLDPTKIRELIVRYEGDGYIMDDPEEIQEVIEHVNSFTYSYQVNMGKMLGGSYWLVICPYEGQENIIGAEINYDPAGKPYTIIGFGPSRVEIGDIWYYGKENEYFKKLFKMLPRVRSSVWGTG